ncbi:MAG: hypothetical protein QXK24_08870 [Ignisphaera sp.]
MPSIGYKYWGVYKSVPDNYRAIPNRIYESRGSFNRELPEDILLGFLKDWRDELEATHGIISNYMEVQGTNFIVQWRVTGTPEPGTIATIVQLILAIALLVAAAYALHELAASIHETKELVSILGPENISMIVQIIFMFFILMFLSPIISMFTQMIKIARSE